MKNHNRGKMMFGAFMGLMFLAGSAKADMNGYKLKITNGSAMPVSPGTLYITSNQNSLIKIGAVTTDGFTRLCQTGNPEDRFLEVNKNEKVLWSQKTTGPILPGESIEVTVPATHHGRAIHFEAMYGKTKDTCAVFHLNASELNGLTQQDVFEGRDEVISTGAFLDPALPQNQGVADVCQSAGNAVDCLRMLAPANSGKKIRFFPGYLPTVLAALEKLYGPEQTQALLIPTSGAVRVEFMSSPQK